MFPNQGSCTEDDYLALPDDRRIELSNGRLEFLPQPTLVHQLVVQFLFVALDAHVSARALGYIFLIGLPIRLWLGKIRQPDVMFLRHQRIVDPKLPPNGADFVIEVLSEGADNHERDLVVKKREYAQAGIGEYWLADPELAQITVFVLQGDQYREQLNYGPGQVVASVTLPGFQVDVAAAFTLPLGKSGPT